MTQQAITRQVVETALARIGKKLPKKFDDEYGIAIYAQPEAEMQKRARVRDYLSAFPGQRADVEKTFVKNLGRETVRAALAREPA